MTIYEKYADDGIFNERNFIEDIIFTICPANELDVAIRKLNLISHTIRMYFRLNDNTVDNSGTVAKELSQHIIDMLSIIGVSIEVKNL